MKNKLKYLNRLDEFYVRSSTVTEPVIKPNPVETPDKDKKKYPNPSTPPQPDVKPGPKNWKEVLRLCVDRFNRLYQENPEMVLAEGLEDNPGLPAYNKLKAKLPAPNMGQFMSLGAEGASLMGQIAQAEQNTFTDEELAEIAKDIVRKVIEGSAILKKGVSFDDFTFDIKFVRDGEDLGSDVNKAPTGEEETEEEITLAISKREIINALTQGFGITSQERMFDEDMNEVVDKINSELLQKYFRFLKVTLDSHKYLDREQFRGIMQSLQRELDNAKEQGERPSSGGIAVPSRVEVEYVDGLPVIKVEAFNLILAIQEMVKGIFEVISLYSFSTRDKETKKRIYAKTENWFNEQQGFVYGPMMVEIFKEFFRAVEDYLMEKNIINEYDDSMILNVLNALYYEEITPDEEFIEIFSLIFNEEVDKSMWPIEKVATIYKEIIEEKGFYSHEPGEDYEDEGIKGYSVSKKEVPTLDELLDKISEFGMKSLTDEEKELLNKYSDNQSKVMNFSMFSKIVESRKRF